LSRPGKRGKRVFGQDFTKRTQQVACFQTDDMRVDARNEVSKHLSTHPDKQEEVDSGTTADEDEAVDPPVED
jgi:hypothetical protein